MRPHPDGSGIAARRRARGPAPAPFVLWTALAGYAINYQINAYTTRGNSIPRIRSDLHRNIVAVFNEDGVQIMTPSYTADPAEPKIPLAPWDGHLAHEAREDTEDRGQSGATPRAPDGA